jgi:hypothetical protein
MIIKHSSYEQGIFSIRTLANNKSKYDGSERVDKI